MADNATDNEGVDIGFFSLSGLDSESALSGCRVPDGVATCILKISKTVGATDEEFEKGSAARVSSFDSVTNGVM